MGDGSSVLFGGFIMDLVTGGLYQGQEKYIEDNYKSCFELLGFVKGELRKGSSEEDIVSLVFSNVNQVEVVNAPEIGAGLIPVDKFERELREVYGRVVCRLSEKAERVIRMVCAIPTVIK